MRRSALLLASLCAATTPDPGAAPRAQSPGPVEWRDIAWPFPRDAWPSGKAFVCASEACGGDAVLSVRVKIGFCNCDAGVRDDDEVDNVADVDMVTPAFRPKGPGEVIRIATYAGRVRSYDYTSPSGAPRTVLGLALASKCDLIAISVNGAGTDASSLQRAAIERLQAQDMLKWVDRQLGGK